MKLQMIAQPDDVTCGPTSLYAVYRYMGCDVELEQVIEGLEFLEEGGTLASFLGIDALQRGFKARIYSYNLHVFDPTWMDLDTPQLIDKLQEQILYKHEKKLRVTTEAYVRFLELGGEICFTDLTPRLLKSYFDEGLPVLAGLSATYLYRTMREAPVHGLETEYDDLRGEPSGHFVVLCGFTDDGVLVADPYRDNPFTNHRYEVDVHRLISSILLGIVTYDANLLIVWPNAQS